MASLNSVQLIGNVGRDAEVRVTQSGQSVAKFSMATSETFGGRDGTDKQTRTDWHDIVCWGRQAEIAGQYVKKGRQVYVEGRLQTRDWIDPQGVKHWKTEVVAHRFLLLGNREQQAVHGSEPDPFDVGDTGPVEFDAPELSPGD
jgi:single-strand DNA-binding protein